MKRPIVRILMGALFVFLGVVSILNKKGLKEVFGYVLVVYGVLSIGYGVYRMIQKKKEGESGVLPNSPE